MGPAAALRLGGDDIGEHGPEGGEVLVGDLVLIGPALRSFFGGFSQGHEMLR
jgi:hypothetical protein